MKREDLIAPQHYNLVSEVERYANDPNHMALYWALLRLMKCTLQH